MMRGLSCEQSRGSALSWAEEEMGGAELGDAWLSRQLVRLVERLAEQPSVSIPAACSGAAETKAAYRLLLLRLTNSANRPTYLASAFGRHCVLSCL